MWPNQNAQLFADFLVGIVNSSRVHDLALFKTAKAGRGYNKMWPNQNAPPFADFLVGIMNSSRVHDVALFMAAKP